MTWETVANVIHPSVRRFKVDGGWIYAIEYVSSPPCACFVPDSPKPSIYYLGPNDEERYQSVTK